MSDAVFFSPHNDDETLFAFYQVLRHKPNVIVVLRSYKQWVSQNGPSYEVREAETTAAMGIADVGWRQWPWSDHEPLWDSIAESIRGELRERKPKVVIAPAWEMGGHEDHNAVASIVAGIEGDWELIRYLTYERGYGRSHKGTPVKGTEEEEALKLKALLCYDSQIRHSQTRAWFPGGAYHTMTESLA
jgi:LmbE family N-acetylglucosaminyl deacetylase